MNQFYHPDILAYMRPEKDLSLHVLVLFSACLFLFHVRKRASPFYFVLLTMVAAHYWPSAWAKLRTNWLLNDELSNMIFSAYANGWLISLDEQTIVKLHQAMRWVDFPLRLITLLAEGSAVICLWNRKSSIIIVASLFLMHLGIALSSGSFF